jgi:hypothetical protein
MGEINWQTVCTAIRMHYKSLARVAKEVNSDWRHLNRLARGDTKEPKYSVGCKLLEIHRTHCGAGQ